jgi:SAM-dependent methyltransferase
MTAPLPESHNLQEPDVARRCASDPWKGWDHFRPAAAQSSSVSRSSADGPSGEWSGTTHGVQRGGDRLHPGVPCAPWAWVPASACSMWGRGSGHALQAAAELLGSTGLAVGVDAAATMATAARARIAGDPNARVCLADAQQLPFADGRFDGCRAERVPQHLTDPAGALAEMARLTRRGGLVLVGDTDPGGCCTRPTARSPTRCWRPPPAAPATRGSGGNWSACSVRRPVIWAARRGDRSATIP